MLEPILPKHPPYQREGVAEAGADAGVSGAVAVDGAGSSPSGRLSWDRLVLVACAVVAALSLVVVAMRASSIAEDQRIQTCQVRVYAQEQATSSFGGRGTQERLARELAECVGDEPSPDSGTD